MREPVVKRQESKPGPVVKRQRRQPELVGGRAMGGTGGQASGGNAGAGGQAPQEETGAVTPSPAVLIFSGPRNTSSRVEQLLIRNQTPLPVTLGQPVLSGPDAARFEVREAAAPGTMLMPGEQAAYGLVFNPVEVGQTEALLSLPSEPPAGGTLEIRLRGLGARGLEGANEPPIQDILQTLGYRIELGSDEFHLPTTPGLLGAEVAAPKFIRAGDGPVGLKPVARYSPNERLPYGYYSADGTLHEIGAIAEGQHQYLNPSTDAGSEVEFDPGDLPFGIFTDSKVHTVYTEDDRNAGAVSHAVRTYPLSDAEGDPILNSYLLCFEEASNGDYQDYIFILENATPAP